MKYQAKTTRDTRLIDSKTICATTGPRSLAPLQLAQPLFFFDGDKPISRRRSGLALLDDRGRTGVGGIDGNRRGSRAGVCSSRSVIGGRNGGGSLSSGSAIRVGAFGS